MTVQTAVLIETLADLGADVRWASCNIFSTQDHAAAAVVVGRKGTVDDAEGLGRLRLEGRDARGVLVVHRPDAHVAGRLRSRPARRRRRATRRCSSTRAWSSGPPDAVPAFDPKSRPRGVGRHPRPAAPHRSPPTPGKWARASAKDIRGVSEETTTGVHRLYEMEKDGHAALPGHQRQRLGHQVEVRQPVRLPALGGRRAQPRHRRDARRARSAVVLGYGDVGKGCAQALKGQGARVVVTEIDPICALQAAMEGYQVLRLRGRGRDRRRLRHGDRQQGHHHRRSTWRG